MIMSSTALVSDDVEDGVGTLQAFLRGRWWCEGRLHSKMIFRNTFLKRRSHQRGLETWWGTNCEALGHEASKNMFQPL